MDFGLWANILDFLIVGFCQQKLSVPLLTAGLHLHPSCWSRDHPPGSGPTHQYRSSDEALSVHHRNTIRLMEQEEMETWIEPHQIGGEEDLTDGGSLLDCLNLSLEKISAQNSKTFSHI